MDHKDNVASAVEIENRTEDGTKEQMTTSAKHGRILHGDFRHPFDAKQKQRWDGVRFGHLEHTLLGSFSECIGEDELDWPEYERTFQSNKGYSLLYKKVDVEHEAERVAEIFRRAINEMVGNSHYEWHHDPEEIRQRVRSGDYAIYGTYEDGLLISVNSLEFIRGHRSAHWMWGAVIPEHRGKGVWENIGVYIDKVTELTGAHFGLVWMVTTHVFSQRMAEKAGWRPVGVFPGSVLLGGSDGKYYRACVIWYAKLYGDGLKHLQAKEDMLLTPMTSQVAEGILDDGSWTVVKKT
jgi:RimJ/RimL family protein N-acetyltransferase